MKRKAVLVDLFAGGGGASSGARSAVKLRRVVVRQFVAVNHWLDAITTYEANHPDADCYHCAVEEVDPQKAVRGNIIDLLIAGPSCTHHSVAQGGRPLDEQSRSSPYSLLNWLKAKYVRAGVFENVPEFRWWGPLDYHMRPIKKLRGQSFDGWIRAIESLGYLVEWRILNAADYGDATSRRRLFVLIRRIGTGPILWPEPTHERPLPAPSKQPSLFQPVKPSWRPAREIIDFSIPMGPETSIFNREAYGKPPLAQNTMRRCLVGLYRHGLKDFLIGQQSKSTPRAAEEPVPTIAGRGAISLVRSFILPPEGIYRGNAPYPLDDILRTITQRGGGHLVSPFIVKLYGTSSAADVDLPLPNVTAQGNHLFLAQATDPHFLVSYHNGEGGDRRSLNIEQPLPTLDTSNRFGLAKVQPMNPWLVNVDHGNDGDRVRSLDEILPVIHGNGGIALANPYIIKYNGTAEAASIDLPLHSPTTRDHFALCVPLVADGLAGGYLLVDLRLRMLHWRELAAAMSFPSSYIWLNAKKKTASNKTITKMIGNAWPILTGGHLCYSQLR